MKYYDSTGTIELTKANTIFVKDQDGHNYAIHDEDEGMFYDKMEEAYEEDEFTEFEMLFPNMIGMPVAMWKNKNLG